MNEEVSSLLLSKQSTVILLQRFAKIGSIITIIIGLLSIGKWQWNIGIHPLFGGGFILLGVSTFLSLQKFNRSTLTGQFLFSLQLLLNATAIFIGFFDYSSPASAINFFLLGSALLLFQFHEIKYVTRVAQILILCAGTISMLAVIGYLYGALHVMSLGCAIVFSILCNALLFVRVDHGITKIVTRNTASSMLAFRLIVITLTLPAIIGYVLLIGRQFHWYGAETEIALLVVGNILLLSSIVWVNTRILQNIELQNLLIKNELEKNNIKLEIDTKELAAKALSLEEKNREITDKLKVRNKLYEITDSKD